MSRVDPPPRLRDDISGWLALFLIIGNIYLPIFGFSGFRAAIGDLRAQVQHALRAVGSAFEVHFVGEDRPYRKKVLTRFPFVVFFRIEGEFVLVDAIAHASRRPGFWTER